MMNELSISINEATEINDIEKICEIFESILSKKSNIKEIESINPSIPDYIR